MARDAVDLSKHLNPREVLSLLREMGVADVDAHQLKLFMTDLKKLIRHDLHGSRDLNENVQESKPRVLKYSRSTFSSRSRSATSPDRNKGGEQKNTQRAPAKPKSGCQCSTNPRRRNVPGPTTARVTRECPCGKSDAPADTKQNQQRKMKSSANFIKVPVEEMKKKSDPVSLYQYYKNLWTKYRRHLPGENDWNDIRWSVREKLLGEKPPSHKVLTPLSEEELEKRRNGWVDS